MPGCTLKRDSKIEDILSQQVSSEDEKKLLIAFRALPSSRKRRMVEDAEEWVAALEKAEHEKP